jgi:hypothetical protein
MRHAGTVTFFLALLVGADPRHRLVLRAAALRRRLRVRRHRRLVYHHAVLSLPCHHTCHA